MKYLLKLSIIPAVYLIFMMVLALTTMAMGENLMWLKYIVAVANLALYGYIVFGVMLREGEKALKVRIANDVERKNIIETGEDRPLNVEGEYKAWKGFVVGLIVVAPLLFLMLIHTILYFTVGETAVSAGGIASIIYYTFYVFINIAYAGESAFICYTTLIAVPIILALTGIPYMIGAKKVSLQQERLSEIEKSIYGEDGANN